MAEIWHLTWRWGWGGRWSAVKDQFGTKPVLAAANGGVVPEEAPAIVATREPAEGEARVPPLVAADPRERRELHLPHGCDPTRLASGSQTEAALAHSEIERELTLCFAHFAAPLRQIAEPTARPVISEVCGGRPPLGT